MKSLALSITFILGLSITAQSAVVTDAFGFLGVKNQAQAQAKDLIEKGQYDKALSQWEEAYGKEPVSQTVNGQATFALLLFKNSAGLVGLEKLSQLQTKQISSGLKEIWNKSADLNLSVWRMPQVSWNSNWNGLFSESVKSAISAWKINEIANIKDAKKAQDLISHLDKKSDPALWLKWQLGLFESIQNHSDKAIGYFQEILDNDQNAVGQDQVVMAAARLMYQSGKLDGALKYYSMIQRKSDYWLEAVEEKAWTYARADNFERTLGETKTLLNSSLAAQVGPEPYFLTALADLRICDYASVFKTLKEFKANNQNRLTSLTALAQTGDSDAARRAVSKMLNGGVTSWAQLGSDAEKLPRLITRDEILGGYIEGEREAQRESQLISQLQNQNPSDSGLSFLRETADKWSHSSQGAITLRIKTLAQIDLKDMKKIVTKLQIAEAETIHRMSVGQNYSKMKHTDIDKNGATIEFPYEENEVWMDELDHYQVSAKGCPVKGAQTL